MSTASYFQKRLDETPVPEGKVRMLAYVRVIVDVDREMAEDPDFLPYFATGMDGVLMDANCHDTWLVRDTTTYLKAEYLVADEAEGTCVQIRGGEDDHA